MTYDPGGIEYRPIRRTNHEISPVRRILGIRNEALVDQARIAAETASEQFQVSQRMTAGYSLAMELAVHSAKLRSFIDQAGGTPDMHTLHAFLLGASTESIVELLRGHEG